jgi:uncharacterized membrane protein
VFKVLGRGEACNEDDPEGVADDDVDADALLVDAAGSAMLDCRGVVLMLFILLEVLALLLSPPLLAFCWTTLVWPWPLPAPVLLVMTAELAGDQTMSECNECGLRPLYCVEANVSYGRRDEKAGQPVLRSSVVW